MRVNQHASFFVFNGLVLVVVVVVVLVVMLVLVVVVVIETNLNVFAIRVGCFQSQGTDTK